MSLVSLVDARKSGDVKSAIADSLELIKFDFSKEIKTVVIKPNMCYYWDYSTGETTDPRFVEALVNLIRSKSPRAHISIVESDASAMKCKYAFKFLGYEKMAKSNGVDLVNLSEEESEKTEVSVVNRKFQFMVPEIIRDADLRINIPKTKRHSLTKISCALKNVYGCNPHQKKYRYHQKIDEVIVALNKIMRFDLCVVDGIIAFGSQPRKLGLVMASLDQVAIDAVVAELARINPQRVRHVLLANSEGLGNVSVRTKGESIEYFKKRFPRNSAITEIMESGYQLVTKLGLSNRLTLSG